MVKKATTDLPLHGGRCPSWLFKRMKELTGAISEVIIHEYSQDELLKRLSNPYFFQSLGCIVGFDWHSSGLTTTLTGALKESMSPEEHGVMIAGGKGKTSRKAPQEILKSDLCKSSDLEKFVDYSKLSAKVDSNCVQDEYSLYHHVFLFTENGKWSVIQQGMNPKNKYARRYHWVSENVEGFIEEPQDAICCDNMEEEVLNLTSKTSEETRKISLDLVKDNPQHLKKYLLPKNQSSLIDFSKGNNFKMPRHHDVRNMDINSRILDNLDKAYQKQPENYEKLVQIKGVGAKSLRALALISQLVYGSEASWKDPATHSYAHGGKDGAPYPVDRDNMERSTKFLKGALEQAEINDKSKLKSLKKLKDISVSP
ncbi:MAG: DUF763 domain-containing protein [Candidatus Aenigmatarchaeota archaeon]